MNWFRGKVEIGAVECCFNQLYDHVAIHVRLAELEDHRAVVIGPEIMGKRRSGDAEAVLVQVLVYLGRTTAPHGRFLSS
jgi:hypothetical protein